MINRHTKFEVSTITCNENMKGNANICLKILVLGDLRIWLGGKRIVDFLLVIIELSRRLLGLRHY